MAISRKGKQTRKAMRKQRAGSRALSIPELKAAFDAVDKETMRILREGGGADSQLKQFMKVWQTIFGRQISKESAQAYLEVKRSIKTRRNATMRRGSAQRGGAVAPLAGAPLDSMLRPGLDGIHASVPSYLANGLTFYNSINQTALDKDCGVVDITPKVPVSIGSNEVMKGGAAPTAAGTPPSPFDAIRLYWEGKPIGTSPDPSQSTKLGI